MHVHLNPGLEDYSCGFCCQPITDADEAVCCDKWIHVSCDQGLSSDKYKDMVNNPSDDAWFCHNCVAQLPQAVRISQPHTDMQHI